VGGEEEGDWEKAGNTAPQLSLKQRVADLERLIEHFNRKGNEIIIIGANLHEEISTFSSCGINGQT
jgi:hypothetical protein